jgi:Spy/CpxP family protein refolding chaperone
MRRVGTIVKALAVGLLVLGFMVAQAAEKDAKYYQKQFTHWSKVIADLKEADVTEGAGQDIEVIRTWISQAQAFLASEKLDEIEPLLRRIEAQAEYVRAKITRLAAEDAAEEAEELSKTAQAQAQTMKAKTDSAAKKLDELESKGL